MDGKNKFSIIERLRSFKYAINGLRLFLMNDHNGRVHFCAAIIAIGLSWLLHISALEWVTILLMIGAVIVTEMINASIEKLADVVSPEYHPKIKIVKDVAAGAVLVTAFLAVIIGAIIFIPKLLSCFS
ncbi:diacylglycerol kinase (ATP) [Pedobacter psychrotolerans]|uniref:Diacylglycerol kinase n=1 Tax=Pedobacter psychrotolerans TaxID=1843235 RepID=A0A4R2H8P2_9SPHI|nr:diacylglycerol kinase family protein [Pedobacter psychrotolerans]TCO22631.1 diacylglycerol kinase (ATP) [Pedobacter psychrotolerans]GGE65978.1 diacylglycerol kinase [Pedobacter psychrotolerans]